MYHTFLYVEHTWIHNQICTQFWRSVSASRHGNMILKPVDLAIRVRSRPPQRTSLAPRVRRGGTLENLLSSVLSVRHISPFYLFRKLMRPRSGYLIPWWARQNRRPFAEKTVTISTFTTCVWTKVWVRFRNQKTLNNFCMFINGPIFEQNCWVYLGKPLIFKDFYAFTWHKWRKLSWNYMKNWAVLNYPSLPFALRFEILLPWVLFQDLLQNLKLECLSFGL